LASAFDLIAHQHILSQIGSFPAREMIRAWLKAGVVEHGRLHRTEDGVPQGGVVSPLLLNVALHGMEKAAGVRYHQTGNSAGKVMTGSPVLIRYADLCGDPHRSAYAERRVMPSRVRNPCGVAGIG
jgi:RNA-directed DNA polymerase